jgi:hypothetical protein
MPVVLRPLAERSHLPTKLADLGRSRKLAVVLTGAFVLLAVGLAAVATACTLDSAVFVPAAVRAVFLILTLVGCGALFYRRVWVPLGQRLGPAQVAHLLEARFPKLNDSLASAVEFLSRDDAHTSARFRRIAVVRAQRGLDRCDPTALVPSGAAWRAFFIAAGVFGVSGALAVAYPEHAGHALVRFADPFGNHPWPTKTRIGPPEFAARAPLGDPFDIKFALAGVIPESAVVVVQIDGGHQYEEHVAVTADSPAAKTVDVGVRLDAHRIPRSFKFRVRANDAETGWHAVTLAPPPKLVPLDGRASPQMHATFPAYTDLPAVDLPDGSGAVEAVHGTRIRFAAGVDRPVVSAVLVPQWDRTPLRTAAGVAAVATPDGFGALAAQALADDVSEDIPLTVDRGGTRLSAEFIPKLSGLYTLRFTDDTGLTGTRLIEFRISPDPAPVVYLDRPLAGKDPVVYLPTAAVTVSARGEDRTFAVRRLFLEYRVGTDAPFREVLLLDLPAFDTPLSAVIGPPSASRREKQLTATAQATIPISLFRKPDGTAPVDGDRITVRAAATDFDDVTVLKEPGRSREEVTLVIVNKSSLETILQQEAAKLRPPLLKVREQQRQARERTQEVAKAAADGQLSPADAAKLGQAEREQRAVRNDISDPRDGLERAAQLLKDTIRANNLPPTTTGERVEAVADDLTRLAEQQLDRAEPLIASAKQEADKAATGGQPDPKKVADDLKKAVRRQQAAEADLDQVLKQLEQWAAAGEVRSEARALKEELTKAGEQGAKAAEKVEPGKPADKLSPPDKAELTRAGDQFNQLADRAAGIISKAERLADEKQAKADGLQAQADAKAAEAKSAAGSPMPMNGDADKMQAEADALKADAAKEKAEADALRSAVQKAGGQDLVNDLRRAGNELQQNNPAQSAEAQKSAGQRLDQLAQSLAEKPEDGDQLKKKKDLADEVDKLAEQQDELNKKVKQAEKMDDPVKREEALKKLAREQEKLKEKTEQAAEKLTREREPEAAQKLRDAAEQMEGAKADLEQGKAPEQAQQDALDRIEESVKKLDQDRQQDQDKLAQEKRAELTERLKGLRERLKATDDEAARIQADVLKQAGWDRAKCVSLGDLEDRAKAVADELRQFAEKELAELTVFKQLVDQAADLTATAGKRFGERKSDSLGLIGEALDEKAEAAADDRTRRPLRTALRRIDLLLNSLKDDPKDQKKDGGGQGGGDMPPGGGGEGGMPPGGGKQNGGVPPIAQLKALRALQADLNDRTREFDRVHPDRAKLTDDDREELDELEKAQREVADLFEKIKPAFEKMLQGGIDQ